MKKFIIKVDMKDVVEYAETHGEANHISTQLMLRYPDFAVGVYMLCWEDTA